MKNKIYALYNGKEYEAAIIDLNTITLKSNDSDDLKNDFSLYKGKIYIKDVTRSEVSEVYKRICLAEYKTFEFYIISETEDKYLISTMNLDYKICEDLDMEVADKGVYQKWIDKKDVKVTKQKVLL
jgi:hypothetical protein